MQILYVEPEPNTRFDTSLLIRGLGHDVLVADSAESALVLLEVAAPDVVYAASQGVHGIDAALACAARERRPKIRIAMGTSEHARHPHAARDLERALACAR